MEEELRYVECCEHGRQQETFVCQHIVQSLKDGIPRGFWSAEADENHPRPDSWCNECEKLVTSVGEWNDETETFAGVKLLCGACYDRAKEMNERKSDAF